MVTSSIATKNISDTKVLFTIAILYTEILSIKLNHDSNNIRFILANIITKLSVQILFTPTGGG